MDFFGFGGSGSFRAKTRALVPLFQLWSIVNVTGSSALWNDTDPLNGALYWVLVRMRTPKSYPNHTIEQVFVDQYVQIEKIFVW